VIVGGVLDWNKIFSNDFSRHSFLELSAVNRIFFAGVFCKNLGECRYGSVNAGATVTCGETSRHYRQADLAEEVERGHLKIGERRL
jgi:hypothetical protein